MKPPFSEYRTWSKERYEGGDGVLIGSDAAQEWLLPWWYKHYIRYNSHPITWVDFGLSPGMRTWCKERGNLVILRIPDTFVATQEEVLPQYYAYWEETYGTSFWKHRNAWFKKPAAFLQTPYERTVWIDSDCEIRGSIAPIFDHSHPFSLRKDIYPLSSGDSVYNTGVVPYRWGFPLIEKWANLAFDCNEEHRGDQELLSQIILDDQISLSELPDIYNRLRVEDHETAIIVHWTGHNGKKIIEHQIVKERLENLFQ